MGIAKSRKSMKSNGNPSISSENGERRRPSSAGGVYSTGSCVQLLARAVPASRQPAGPRREVSDRTVQTANGNGNGRIIPIN